MWVFTTMGFFSAVRIEEPVARELELPRHNDPWVMVRARVREDAENLLALWYELHQGAEKGKALLVPGETSEIIEWPNRDYPYRVIMPRTHWAGIMEHLAGAVDYPNFKNQVKAAQGMNRSLLYGRVWGVMYGAERGLKKAGLESPGSYRGLFDDEPELIRTPRRIRTPLPPQGKRSKRKQTQRAGTLRDKRKKK